MKRSHYILPVVEYVWSKQKEIECGSKSMAITVSLLERGRKGACLKGCKVAVRKKEEQRKARSMEAQGLVFYPGFTSIS